MSHLWLPLFLLNLASSESDLHVKFTSSIFLFFVVFCKVMFSIQIKDDEAGKTRWVHYFPTNIGIVISIVLVTAGLTTVLIASGAIEVVLAYSAAVIVGLFYSLRPVRFKERGIWGLVAYASAATLIYVLVPWTWMGSNLALLVLLIAAVFADKWVQLHFHQVVDYQADLKSYTQTYAVKAGLERTRRTLRVAAWCASLFMVFVLIYMLFYMDLSTIVQAVTACFCILIVVAVGIYTRIMKNRSEHESDLIKELPWIYLGLTYLVFFILPPLGFLYLTRTEPRMAILTAIAVYSLLSTSWHSIRYKYT